MDFRQFLDDHLGCASYLIASPATSDAAIIDPGHDIAPYQQIIAERGYRLRFVIDTHIHADHLSGARALAAAHGTELCLHQSARTAYPFLPLHDDQELALGQLRLRILHTPGHRSELISLLVSDLDRGSDPLFVLTGDSLLVGDAGRPDFNGGDPRAQYQSVRRLLELPDWAAVFPGHVEGLCGANIYGLPSTTIGLERRLNPLAQLSQDAFVAALTASVPPRPLNSTAIEAANRGEIDFVPWATDTSDPKGEERSVDQLVALGAEAFIVDLREPAEFQVGHLTASLNVPQADLATRIDELPRDRTIACICHTGRRSRHAAQFLSQIGFDNVVSVAGGVTAWIASGRPVSSTSLGCHNLVTPSKNVGLVSCQFDHG